MNEDDMMKQFEQYFNSESVNKKHKDTEKAISIVKDSMNKITLYITEHVIEDIVNPDRMAATIDVMASLSIIKKVVDSSINIITEITKENDEND